MIKEDCFKVFNSKTLGRRFIPYGLNYDKVKAVKLSVFHGRAVAIQTDEFKWISVKGGGWNYGGPQIYLSKKDEELVFGLYPLQSAERELAVSKKILEFSKDYPKVLYFRKICDEKLPKKLECLKDLTYKSGMKVEPCLLYTQLNCPARVSDLFYFTDKERDEYIKYCCKFWNVSVKDYVKTFIERLAFRVALLHKNGFINDTLDFGNVTLLAEIVDYEWVTAPGIKLFDGTYGEEIRDERKEKEILYGAEVSLQLCAVLQQENNFFDIYKEFVNSYKKINGRFIEENDFIQKILNKREIVI